MTDFHGLVQHSFALRLSREHQAFARGSTRDRIAERFEPRPKGEVGIRLRTFDEALEDVESEDGRDKSTQKRQKQERERASRHSPLVQAQMTTVRPRPVRLLAHKGKDGSGDLPDVLAWARPGEGAGKCDSTLRPRMIFAEFEEERRRESENDFLIDLTNSTWGASQRAREVAMALLEAIAFRRSQLFGLPIANRFINVMLPSAVLQHQPGQGCGQSGKPWNLTLQPLLSLMRDGRDRQAFRAMYSLTFFVIPCDGDVAGPRPMSIEELGLVVNAGWSLADFVPRNLLPKYWLDGDLSDYLGALTSPEVSDLCGAARSGAPLSLRQAVEIVAFGVAMRMAQGSTGTALPRTRNRIGDDVITSLGTSRVSAAVLVDEGLGAEDIRKPIEWRDPPGSLKTLMSALACETRPPHIWGPTTRREYMLDRPFVDGAGYAVGLVPRNRCLLVTNVDGHKKSRGPESLISQVAAVAYMTAGAASAIGTMRAIDRDLEQMEHQDPRKLAEIDGEIATDLHEIYDLDISRETYRHLYRRLRDGLGITRDYDTLQDKMQALYRATSTFHGAREQRLLAWLTAAIVVLSLLLLLKPG